MHLSHAIISTASDVQYYVEHPSHPVVQVKPTGIKEFAYRPHPKHPLGKATCALDALNKQLMALYSQLASPVLAIRIHASIKIRKKRAKEVAQC